VCADTQVDNCVDELLKISSIFYDADLCITSGCGFHRGKNVHIVVVCVVGICVKGHPQYVARKRSFTPTRLHGAVTC
jgi:hypothetical protein